MRDRVCRLTKRENFRTANCTNQPGSPEYRVRNRYRKQVNQTQIIKGILQIVRSLRKNTAVFNHARDTWASAHVIAGAALNILHHIHPLDALAENDKTIIAPRTGMGGDEELS